MFVLLLLLVFVRKLLLRVQAAAIAVLVLHVGERRILRQNAHELVHLVESQMLVVVVDLDQTRQLDVALGGTRRSAVGVVVATQRTIEVVLAVESELAAGVRRRRGWLARSVAQLGLLRRLAAAAVLAIDANTGLVAAFFASDLVTALTHQLYVGGRL